MKSIKWVIALLVLVVAASGSAWADRGHRHGHGRGQVHFGVVIGPLWGPWWYPPPRYYSPPYPYYPSVVVERPAPTVYIEQPAAAAPAPAPQAQTNYWYYCDGAKGYYPYVKECPTGWQRVLPQPPGQH